MTRIASMVFSGFCCVCIMGCAGPRDVPHARAPEADPRERVIGSYTASGGLFLTEVVFLADGTYIQRIGGSEAGERTGTWQLDGNRLMWTIDDQKREAVVVNSDEQALELIMLESAGLVGGDRFRMQRSR